MSIEAMKQALEALEELHRTGDTQVFDMCYAPKVIPALRQAIEQAEKQEPNAWRDHASDYERGFIDGMQKQMQSSVDKAVNAMSKREWVGLTDEEIMEMLDYGQYGRVPQYARNFVDAIEAKLKEKNT
jgi:hypothetical protein